MSNKLGVSNIYELLDDDNDGGVETGKKVQAALQEKKKAETIATAPAPQKPATNKPAPATSQNKGKQSDSRRNDRPQGENKGRQDRPRTDRGDKRPPRSFDSPRPTEGEEGKVDNRRNRERTGGDRERRGPRPEGEVRGNKRLYDRKSGTGRGKETKKGGAGKGNWGSIDDPTAVVEEGTKTETEEVKKEGEEATTAATEEGATTEKTEKVHHQQEPEEEEEKVRSLEEYLKDKKSPAVELPAPRKAGEGVEQPKEWEKFVPLKKEDDSLFPAASKSKKEKAKEGTETDKKVVPVDSVFKVQSGEQRQRKNPRDNKSGAKPTNRGPRGSQSTPNIGDKNSFPSLSQKA
jgi:plasminogen activator inhibitor 1 RNA-binding protein